MIVKTLDGKEVDITHCDAGYSPGSPTKTPILNTTACWCKVEGVWVRSPHRSAMFTADIVRHNSAKDLVSIFSGKEIKDGSSKVGAEGSDSGDGEADATKLQTLQGYSAGDADK